MIHLKPAKDQASSKRKSLVDSMSMEEDEDDEFFDARERLGQIFLWNRLTHLTQIVSAMCRYDELSLTMSGAGCVL